jgi:hypothetical protein
MVVADVFFTEGAGADAAGALTVDEPDDWWCNSFFQMSKRAIRISTARAAMVTSRCHAGRGLRDASIMG